MDGGGAEVPANHFSEKPQVLSGSAVSDSCRTACFDKLSTNGVGAGVHFFLKKIRFCQVGRKKRRAPSLAFF